MYFAIAFGWTWLCWLTAAALGLTVETPAGGILMLAGLLGPMIGGVTCTRRLGKAAWREYGRRIYQAKRISAGWYAVIALIVPALFVAAVGLDRMLGGTGGHWEESALQIAASPLSIIPFALPIFLIGPMEEFGWRGFALDFLQKRSNALVASLTLGVAWSAWHLPLFLIPGTYQNGLGIGTQAFWLFVIGIVPLNVAFTWVYNNTNRSILGAIAIVVTLTFGAETMTRRHSRRVLEGSAPHSVAAGH